MSALLLSILTFFSTALGGAFALRFRNKLYLIMGFSAGILVAAALVDLLPEAAEMIGWSPQQAAVEKSSHEAFIDFTAPSSVFLSAVLGFLLYYSLDFFVHLGAAGHVHQHAHHHHTSPETPDAPGPSHPSSLAPHPSPHASRFGSIAAAGLVVHSLLDGFAIGGASHTDSKLLILVAIAVLAHDFGDGVTTVGIVLGFRGGLRASIGWLLADAIAPVIGCASGIGHQHFAGRAREPVGLLRRFVSVHRRSPSSTRGPTRRQTPLAVSGRRRWLYLHHIRQPHLAILIFRPAASAPLPSRLPPLARAPAESGALRP